MTRGFTLACVSAIACLSAIAQVSSIPAAAGGGASGTIATTPNVLKGDNAGNAVASTAGTDFAAANASTTVNGTVCALASTCTIGVLNVASNLDNIALHTVGNVDLNTSFLITGTTATTIRLPTNATITSLPFVAQFIQATSQPLIIDLLTNSVNVNLDGGKTVAAGANVTVAANLTNNPVVTVRQDATTNAYTVSVAATSSAPPMEFNETFAGNAVASGTPRYGGLNTISQTTQATVQTSAPFRVGQSFKNLTVLCNTALQGAGTLTLTFEKNLSACGSPGTMTVVVPTSQACQTTPFSAQDLTNTCAVGAVTDTFDIKAVQSAASSSTGITFSVQLQ